MASIATILPGLLPSLQERRKKNQLQKIEQRSMRQRKSNVMEYQMLQQQQQLQLHEEEVEEAKQQLQLPEQNIQTENQQLISGNSSPTVQISQNGAVPLRIRPSPSCSSLMKQPTQQLVQSSMSDSALRKTSWVTSREIHDYKNLFNCLICVEAGSPIRPRLLACDHLFCEHCLHAYWSILNGGSTGLLERRNMGGTSIACPICRKLTVISADGSIGHEMAPDDGIFPNNGIRKISQASDNMQRCDTCIYKRRIEAADFYCAKCTMNYCTHCRTAHDQHPLFKDHSIIHITSKDTFNLCCEPHGRQDCLYFCMDCDQPCCTVCVMLQEEHRLHSTARLRDALAARRDALKNLLNDFAPKLDWLEAKVRRLSRVRFSARENKSKSGSLSSFSDANNDDIVCGANMRRATVAVVKPRPGKPALVSHSLSQDEIASSVALADGMARSVSHDNLTIPPSPPESPSPFPRGSMGTGLFQRGPIGLDLSPSPSPRGRTGEDRWLLSIMTSHTERIGRLFVLATGLLEMSQSKKLLAVYTDVATRIRTVLDCEINQLQTGLDEIFAREAAAATALIGQQGSSNQKTVNFSSDAESSPPYSGTASSDCRTRHGSGVSETSTTILLDQELARGKTLSSMLVRPKLLWKVEKQRADQGELWNPCGAAFLPDRGGLIVAEYDVTNDKKNKLRVFDHTGRSITNLGSGQIQPLGVSITREGNVAVTDCKAKRVKIITLAGQTQIEIGKGQFSWPYGIATTSKNQLVVTDAFNDSVSVYSMEGKKIRQFGSSGAGNSQFRNPYHVALDSKDNIYVSDSGNNCIKVFDINGRYIFSASETGIKRSGSSSSMASLAPSISSTFSTSVLSTPNGGLMDASSPLRGSDSLSYTSRKSSTASTVGRLKRRRLRNPRGVAVDQKGNILVADDCCRVCMFDGAGRYVRHLLTDEDQVRYPEVVSCSSDGQLVVTEWNPNNMFAVKVFTLYETSQV